MLSRYSIQKVAAGCWTWEYYRGNGSSWTLLAAGSTYSRRSALSACREAETRKGR